MRYVDDHPNREISPRTRRNFFYAHTRRVMWGGSIYFINWRTDQFRLLPTVEREENVQWWDLTLATSQVNVTRWYWLCVGVARVRPIHPIHIRKDFSEDELEQKRERERSE